MFGFLNVYKPKGKTSHDVVAILRRVTKIKQIGHTGTLDPFAEGVLPICIGKATRLIEYLNDDKAYISTVQLGKSTTTYDLEGETVDVSDKTPDLEEIENELNNFRGDIEQLPPIYSAIKVNGKKLYEYARKGIEVEVKPRTIEIYKLELIKIENMEITFRVSCSKGTYIRTLCEKIAEELGTIGYMKDLKRIQVGEFNIKDSITIEELENQEIVSNKFITIEKYFNDYEKIVLNERKLQLFLNGVQLTYELKDGIYKIYKENEFVGIGTVKNKLLKRDIIL